MVKTQLNLKGFSFQELLTAAGLRRLDQQFLAVLQSVNPGWHEQLLAYRHQPSAAEPTALSQLLIDCAVVLEQFIAQLYDIEEAVALLQAQTLAHQPIFGFKTYYVKEKARRALAKITQPLSFADLNQWVDSELSVSSRDLGAEPTLPGTVLGPAIKSDDGCGDEAVKLPKNLALNLSFQRKLESNFPVQPLDSSFRWNDTQTADDRQLAIAKLGLLYLSDPAGYAEQIARLVDWCIAAMTTAEGQSVVAGWEMFHLPKHLDFSNLVAVQPVADDNFGRLQGRSQRHRDGFELTDTRMTQRQAMAEVHYCIYCHDNQGDFCSRGFPIKKSDLSQGLKTSPTGDTLTGCPLEEKISEMHALKRDGFGIAALAMIMVDNPMCPVTGHRICNDCMKACIYQKQEPVNIPQTETRILTDVLHLPWGVEIYDLLTRWNPLRATQWAVKPYNGLKILVMGMGPAGFSLAHHLLMEGFAVVGMDGLKIEPLPAHYVNQPIQRFEEITENLADRVTAGFGGVAEYGITVRWDKNFLKLIYISLSRKQYFQVLGGIRFGGTLKVEDAWLLGFDHLALAVGAGLPKELAIANSLAPGMRQANDFLMALQLTGAAKSASLANLQVRLPAVVIGGGLTAVDAATELQAYYLVQVEKIAARYQTLAAHFGENSVRSRFLAADLPILDEFLLHAGQIAAERRLAEQQQRLPDLIRLIRQWGGVTIAYRRTMQESPAYRRNHEELGKALEEGIYYAEGLEPKAAILDADGQVQALRCQWSIWDEQGQWVATDEEQALPARAILVATGARLNVAYEFEHRGTFLRQDRFEYRRYERVHGHLRHLDTMGHVKGPHFGAFTSYAKDHRTVTFLGDTHPVFHGSVVKAIASAQRVYPEICAVLAGQQRAGDDSEYQAFRAKIQQLFSATVEAVRRHNHRVVELVVRAPIAARNGSAGQFYRVQNFESSSLGINLSFQRKLESNNGAVKMDSPQRRLGLRWNDRPKATSLQMEAMALLGVHHLADPDLLSFYVVEKGVSSRLVQYLQPGDPLALMGPTGAHSTQLLQPATILVIGNIMSPVFLLAMAEKFRSGGHRIWYLGYFEQAADVYAQEQLETVAEKIIWLSEHGDITARRAQDQSFQHGDVVKALQRWPDLSTVQQVWVIGSSCLLQTVQAARQDLGWPQGIPVIGSVYGPMQCMLKGVCAQCLQWQLDPRTGKRSKAVYACSWQHQPLERVDIGHIDERLSQNRCQETLSQLWLDYLASSSR